MAQRFIRCSSARPVENFKETASGAKNDRAERKKVMELARAREIDAILVTQVSRWGRSTQDLVQALDDLHGWKVSVLAQTGLSFDLSTAWRLVPIEPPRKCVVRKRVFAGFLRLANHTR